VIDVEDPVRVGDTETYTITVTNQGTAADTNIKIECTLPPNVEYVSATGTTAAMAGAGSDGVVRFTPVGSLPPKAKAAWSVVVRGKSAADARFTVVLNTDQLMGPVQENEATYFYE
jgi:uncharacterized repeat protein (TIGR01451 family)